MLIETGFYILIIVWTAFVACRMDRAITWSWHLVFIPLYTAVGVRSRTPACSMLSNASRVW